MWVTFNVREDLLQGLGMNTEFEAFIPALDKNIRLKVYYLKRPRHICRLESDQDYRPVRPENIRSKSRSAREGGRTASGNECCIEEVKRL